MGRIAPARRLNHDLTAYWTKIVCKTNRHGKTEIPNRGSTSLTVPFSMFLHPNAPGRQPDAAGKMVNALRGARRDRMKVMFSRCREAARKTANPLLCCESVKFLQQTAAWTVRH